MAAPIGKHAASLFPSKIRYISLLVPRNIARTVQPVRNVRAFGRRPVRVLTPEEDDILHQNKFAPVETPTSTTRTTKYPSKLFPPRAEAHDQHQERDPDKFYLPPDVKYEKLLEGDKRFGPVVMATKSRKLREKKGIILLEGTRLILDAVDAGAELKSVYFTKVEHLEGLPLEEINVDLFKVHMSHMKLWSDVNTPPGVMAICKLPKPGELLKNKEDLLPVTLLCDNLRDPGNMGTLLRTAAAVGCQKVLLTKGCVDVWEPKVLRAGAGSHFRLHIINKLGWEIVGNYLHENAQVFLAECSGHMPRKPERPPRWLLEKISAVEPAKYIEKNEDTEELREVDETYLDKDTVELYKRFPLSVKTYSEVDYTEGEPVIIIGGETEGVSAAAYKLAYDRNGDRVFIPMMSGVNSLNSAVAATVILYEAQKQLLQEAAEERTDSELEDSS